MDTKRNTSSLVRGAALLTLLYGVLAGGCNIVTPIAMAVSPPPKQEAEFHPVDRPTVVYVDDRQNALNDRGLRMYIGDLVAERLLKEEVLTDAIKTSAAMAASGGERAGDLKSLEQIGLDVGAAQVIYIEVKSFGIQANAAGAPRAQAQVGVKLIDVENRVRLYPPPGPEDNISDTRNLVITLPPEMTYQPVLTRASQSEAERTLAGMIADKVAKLFYTFEIAPMGDNSAPESRFN